MKKIYISVLAMSLFGFISCEDFMDVHKQYIEDGDETVYAPKVDSMVFRAGEGQILFQCWLINSPNVDTVVVYWNNGLNKLPIPVPSSTSDTVFIEEFIPNLEEKSYSFDVRTIDAYGHHSLKTTGSGASYGTFFRSTLNQRRVDVGSTVEVGTDIQIRVPWGAAVGNLVQNEIRYTAVGNVQKVIKVSPTESLTSIADAAAGSTFEYRSRFLPEPNAVDTFSLGWESLTIDPVVFLDKTGWEVIAFSDEEGSDRAANIIDGNMSTQWHTAWRTPSTFPHWAVIDMKSPKNFTRIETHRTNFYTKTVQYFVSDDPAHDALTWVKIGDADVVFPDVAPPLMLTTNISSGPNKRYLKIYLDDSNAGVNSSIYEIQLYRD